MHSAWESVMVPLHAVFCVPLMIRNIRTVPDSLGHKGGLVGLLPRQISYPRERMCSFTLPI